MFYDWSLPCFAGIKSQCVGGHVGHVMLEFAGQMLASNLRRKFHFACSQYAMHLCNEK